MIVFEHPANNLETATISSDTAKPQYVGEDYLELDRPYRKHEAFMHFAVGHLST